MVLRAHVIDDNLRQRTAGLFCGIIQKPRSRELYRMIARTIYGANLTTRAMLNEHQLAGVLICRPGKTPAMGRVIQRQRAASALVEDRGGARKR